MAELGDTLKKLKPGVTHTSGERDQASGSPEGLTGQNLRDQMDGLKFIMAGVIIVLFTAFIAAIIAYFQFVWSANVEYKNSLGEFNNTVRDYNNQRYNDLQNRINNLERILTGTPTPTPS